MDKYFLESDDSLTNDEFDEFLQKFLAISEDEPTEEITEVDETVNDDDEPISEIVEDIQDGKTEEGNSSETLINFEVVEDLLTQGFIIPIPKIKKGSALQAISQAAFFSSSDMVKMQLKLLFAWAKEAVKEADNLMLKPEIIRNIKDCAKDIVDNLPKVIKLSNAAYDFVEKYGKTSSKQIQPDSAEYDKFKILQYDISHEYNKSMRDVLNAVADINYYLHEVPDYTQFGFNEKPILKIVNKLLDNQPIFQSDRSEGLLGIFKKKGNSSEALFNINVVDELLTQGFIISIPKIKKGSALQAISQAAFFSSSDVVKTQLKLLFAWVKELVENADNLMLKPAATEAIKKYAREIINNLPKVIELSKAAYNFVEKYGEPSSKKIQPDSAEYELIQSLHNDLQNVYNSAIVNVYNASFEISQLLRSKPDYTPFGFAEKPILKIANGLLENQPIFQNDKSEGLFGIFKKKKRD